VPEQPLFFVVVATDAEGKQALRQELRPLHREWLREHPGHPVKVVHGGPTLDAAGAMTGTVLIVEAGSEQAVASFLAADPYVRHGLFSTLQIRRWAWSLGRQVPGQRTTVPSPMKSFTYAAQPARVVFGAGSLNQLSAEIDRLGARRALVLSTPEQRASAARIAEMLGDRSAGVFDRAVMHVPIETAREAREVAVRLRADCAVAIGGGSTTGLGKAIALESGLPIIAVPTTYAGSEMTPIYGITEAGLKKTGRDPRVLPRTVIYDPELTLGLPVGISVTSAINAIAHAAEGLYAEDGNPVMDLAAEEGIRALAGSLAAIRANPRDIDARGEALYGAWLCGMVLGSVGMALHHKLCHTLGGSFNLPHAETHTIVLPHALAYNAAAAPVAMQRIARALAAPDAAQGAYDLARDNGAPVALRDIGMRAEDLDQACEIALRNQYPNPRPLEPKAIRGLLQDAFEGRRPGRGEQG
jgi:maleylacetate reductase